jgi:hypothetical protein
MICHAKKRRPDGIGSKRCNHCPKYTPNRSGICDVCLQLGYPERANQEAQIRGREPIQGMTQSEISKMLRESRRDSVPAAVLRGRGCGVRR